MEMIEKIDNEKLEVVVMGRLDSVTAPELEELIKKYIEEIKEIIFDFSELEYISSAGLRVLLASQRMINKKEGTMCVKNVNETVNEVFEVTGFSDILTII